MTVMFERRRRWQRVTLVASVRRLDLVSGSDPPLAGRSCRMLCLGGSDAFGLSNGDEIDCRDYESSRREGVLGSPAGE